MSRLSDIAIEVKALAQEQLGRDLIQDVDVSDYVDEGGERAYQVLIVVSEFDPAMLTAKKRSGLAVAIIHKLASQGDSKFPFITFVPRDELAELAAND